MKTMHVLVLAAAAALASGHAFAQDGAPMGPPKFDANGDGAISKAEAAKFPRLAERFDQLDKNKDGKLTGDEQPRRGAGQRGERIAALDTNKDGRISKAEAQADKPFATRFAQLDANKDGYLDRAELAPRNPGAGR